MQLGHGPALLFHLGDIMGIDGGEGQFGDPVIVLCCYFQWCLCFIGVYVIVIRSYGRAAFSLISMH